METFKTLRPYGIKGVYEGDKFTPVKDSTRNNIKRYTLLTIYDVDEDELPYVDPRDLIDDTNWDFSVFGGVK